MSSLKPILIVIPARYNSTRFPGKPLAVVAGKTMLQHVCAVATAVAERLSNTEVLVATDDERIIQHVEQIAGVQAVMTPSDCPSGTDRIIAAVRRLSYQPHTIINLQGDAPLTPQTVLEELILQHQAGEYPVATPAIQLNWQQLDNLRDNKRTAAFSGTTVVINANREALWFSKNIIPALRNETKLRIQPLSPVYQHLGMYAYSMQALDAFATLPMGTYEQLEGLEQLRFLENQIKIKIVPIATDTFDFWRGVDTPQDAEFVAQLIGRQL